MANEFVTVIDDAGVGRQVLPCDAREIVEAGGHYPEGEAAVPDIKPKAKVTHPAETKPKK